jgi:hypothetical protein
MSKMIHKPPIMKVNEKHNLVVTYNCICYTGQNLISKEGILLIKVLYNF